LGTLRVRVSRFFASVKLTDKRLLLACVGIGFLVRLVPELLAFPLPIGFDTISYAVVMKSGVVWAHWSQFFTSTWLLYALVVPLYGVTQVNPFLLLKLVAPALFGLNVAGVYWFSRKFLGWNMSMGLFASIFFSLQLASLRISWDLLRNILGLGILLFALSFVKDVGSRRGFALFTCLSVLAVFAHEYSAVILFFSVSGLVVWKLVKRELDSTLKPFVLGILPALSVFLAGVYLRLYPVRYFAQSNVIVAGDTVSGSSGVFFFVNYLNVQNSVDSYSSYFNLALNVGLLFTVLFLPYLFLVIKGFFRNRLLDLWTSLLLAGAFGCLIVPFFALQFWHRWMFMLAYPFTFYAVKGLARLPGAFREKRIGFSALFSKKICAVALLLTFGIGIAYLATPVLMVYADTSVPSISGTYLYFSTSPTVPYEDVAGVIQAMNWLEGNMVSASSVVLQHAFVPWGSLYLDRSHTIVEFDKNISLAVSTAAELGFSQIYFVWWNTPIGWYGLSVPDNYVRVQDFGRISVYAYEGELGG